MTDEDLVQSNYVAQNKSKSWGVLLYHAGLFWMGVGFGIVAGGLIATAILAIL